MTQTLRQLASAAMLAQLPAFAPSNFQDTWKRTEAMIVRRFEKPGRGQAKRQVRVFEVHHAIEHARTHFLQAIVDIKTPSECQAIALSAIDAATPVLEA